MTVARVNGVELSFDDRGGDGFPLLLVCGAGMHAAMWDGYVRNALDAAGYRTIAFDNRGIPPSEVTAPPYSVEQMADDTIGLLEHLGIDRAFLVGASLGASISQTVALKRPDLVRAAVLDAGGGNVTLSGRLDMQLMLAAMKAEIGQVEAVVAWAGADHLSELADMQPPVLLIAHEFDVSFSVRGREDAAAMIPRSSLFVLEGANHVPLDPAAPETTQAEILSFLAGH